MFSWAASTFESIVQTVAPPPSDPNAKLVYCCQQGDEQGAIQILQNPQSAMAPDGNDGGNYLPVDPIRTIVVQLKGYTLLHLACLNTMPQLLDYILARNDMGDAIWSQIRDAEGNTPLHCASMSNSSSALNMIKKILVYRSSPDGNEPATSAAGSPPLINTALVGIKNYNGLTPYDVASLNSVRQYLLPIQLQAETQEALANGGVGLPPGIDMGGLKIQHTNLPPPPSAMPPPVMGGGGPVNMTAPTSRYAAPPMPVIGGGGGGVQPSQQSQVNTQQYLQQQLQQQSPAVPFQQQTQPPPQAATSQFQAQPSSSLIPSVLNQQASPLSLYTLPVEQKMPPSNANIGNPPGLHGTSPSLPLQMTTTTTQTMTNASNRLPEAPKSGSLVSEAPKSGGSGYALVGGSSAALLSRYKNDGFHSSSSDKNLQAKYGHASTDSSRSTIPPPPSSGNAGVILGGGGQHNIHSAPPSLNTTGGANPFAGGTSGIVHRRPTPAGSRYVNYDPIRGTSVVAPLPPPPNNAAYSNATSPAITQPFLMFTPGGSANTTSTSCVPSNCNPSLAAPQSQQHMQSSQTQQPQFSNSHYIPPLPPLPAMMAHRTSSLGASCSSSTSMPIPLSSPNPHLLVQPTPANTPIAASMLNSTFGTPEQTSRGMPPSSGNAVNLFGAPPSHVPQQTQITSGNAASLFASPQGAVSVGQGTAATTFGASSAPGVPLSSPPPVAGNPIATLAPPAPDSKFATFASPPPHATSPAAVTFSSLPATSSTRQAPGASSQENQTGQTPLNSNSTEMTQSERAPAAAPASANESCSATLAVSPPVVAVDHNSDNIDEEDEGMMDEIPLTPGAERLRKQQLSQDQRQQLLVPQNGSSAESIFSSAPQT